jgi:hypothetical protein
LPLLLTLGSPPPAPPFFFYAGPALNSAGKLPVTQTQITSAGGRNIIFRLKNGSAADSQTYQVTGHVEVTPPASSAGWTPLTPLSLPPVVLLPNTETVVSFQIKGPQAPSPAPALGTLGTVIVSAVLTQVNGAPPTGTQQPIEVPIPFIIV